MRIELDIDELVLDGFDGRDRFRIRAAVERELARLFATRGVLGSLSKGYESGCVDAGPIDLPAEDGVGTVRSQTAATVHRGLCR